MHWKEEVRKHRLNLKKILEALGILEEEKKGMSDFWLNILVEICCYFS